MSPECLKLRQVDESQSFKNKVCCELIKKNYGVESFSFKPISKDDTIQAVKQSINHEWHTNLNNKEFCWLLLWEACKYF